MRRLMLLAAILIAAGTNQAPAASAEVKPQGPIEFEYHVDDNALNDPGPNNPAVSDPLENGSTAHPFDTIQEAIDAASNGWTVTVATGRYRENINFGGKRIIVCSSDPLNKKVVASTTIDGTNSGPTVLFHGDEGPKAALLGFRIIFGNAGYGGGVSGGGTLATIRYNFITSNTATRQGGGLYHCHGLVANNTITSNSVLNETADISLYGGGLSDCDGRITTNTISGNVVKGSKYTDYTLYAQAGGGLARCDGTIEGNLIRGNIAVPRPSFFRGRGAGLYDCQGPIRHNTIDANEVTGYGGGLSRCHGTIEYNAISNNYGEWGGGGLDECNGVVRKNTVDGNQTSEFGPGICRCAGIVQANLVIRSYSFGANGWGGGIHGCDGDILDNVVALNESYLGGGGISDCQGLIQNNTIVYNRDGHNAGVYDCHGTINNCVIWGNHTTAGSYQLKNSSVPSYSTIEGWTAAVGGTGNSAANPLFVNAATQDYRLAAGSPCIDAGSNSALAPDRADMDGDGDTSETTPLDFGGLPRVMDGNGNGVSTVDKGAHEYAPLVPGKLHVPALTAPSSGSVTVPVWISGVDHLRSVSALDIRYDPRVLHLPGANRVSRGSLIPGGPLTVTISETSTSGLVRISASSATEVNVGAPQTLFSIRFDVVGLQGGRSVLGLDCQGLLNGSGANLPAARLSGSVSVTPKVANKANPDWRLYEE